LEALTDFAEGEVLVRWDSQVPGLQVRVGKHRVTWAFLKEHSTHGKRGVTFKRLGFYPGTDVKAARKLALQEAGRVAAGRITPGRRAALKVDAALDAYLEHLRARPKGATWAKNVASVARVHIRPEFGSWPLNELSAVPARVRDWHKKITRQSGPVAANKAAKILRAAYRHAARLDRALPPALPTSAVEMNAETRSQRALAPADFPKWKAAWDEIDSPTRKAFQMIGLLSGMRPGELARLKWADVLPRERCFVIRGAKANNDIRVPMSAAIARALKLARDAARGSEWVFPARAGGHIVKFDADDLPAWGMMYRRTWRTIAADLGIDELIAHFCLGHIPAGISRGYVVKMTLASGAAMRAAQRRISAEIVRRLGIEL
jgi:integrase